MANGSLFLISTAFSASAMNLFLPDIDPGTVIRFGDSGDFLFILDRFLLLNKSQGITINSRFNFKLPECDHLSSILHAMVVRNRGGFIQCQNVRAVLHRGASVQIRNSRNQTPLHQAFECDDTVYLRLVLQFCSAADLVAVDLDAQTPCSMLLSNQELVNDIKVVAEFVGAGAVFDWSLPAFQKANLSGLIARGRSSSLLDLTMWCVVELGVAVDAASGLVPLPVRYQRIVAGFLLYDGRSVSPYDGLYELSE